LINFTSLLTNTSDKATDITLQVVTKSSVKKSLDDTDKNWVEAVGFTGKAGSLCPLPSKDGKVQRVLYGVGQKRPAASDPWWLAIAAEKLQPGTYKIVGVSEKTIASGALGWCLAQHKYDRYLTPQDNPSKILVLGKKTKIDPIVIEARGITFARNLINTPTEDMGPSELQDNAERIAEKYGAQCSTIVGGDLLKENFPAIHAVGRAATKGRAPRLIDMSWGDPKHPKITLVGKGVCFDTGGLDVKPSAGMRIMKKDMGGAAHALGLARMIMAKGLKVRLRVLIPAVENAISANAYRPGDVIATRKGLSVEIGNTDAEGRVILCDALTLACEEKPDLLMDFATLTGAARVALGPELPATFTNSDDLWFMLQANGQALHDPLWRMPLWDGYDTMLDSDIADLNNVADGGFGGAITAALYLQHFVGEKIRWAHFDVYGWAPSKKPGRPKGGAAQALRASLATIEKVISV
jgi:leucyl aminopeptidase